MKQIQKIVKKLYRPNLLAGSIAAVCTAIVATSVTQASDIDIYQEAKSGKITLMFMLDISGSMGAPQLTGDTEACDIPFPGVATGSGSLASTNGNPSYTRYYCTGTVERTYKVRRYVSGRYYYYQRCTNTASRIQNCSWGTATTSTNNFPSYDTTESDDTYTYYISGSGSALPTQTYFDRITRLKDGMFDLLYGNTSKGITKLDNDKVIGLSTFSRPTSFDSSNSPLTADNVSGQVRIPARPLGNLVGGVSQRQILLNEIATLGARGGTPTANAYAETAAYLFGTKTAGTTYANIPIYFRYYPLASTTRTYYYRRTGTTSYTYYRCQSNGTGVTSTGSCTSTSTVNSSAVNSMEGYTTGNPRYYYQDIPVYSNALSYRTCLDYNSGGCNTWSAADSTDPTASTYTTQCTVEGISGECVFERKDFNADATSSGFNYSYPATKNARGTLYVSPESLTQEEEIKKCSGQGIYVLTDGAPNNNGSAKSLMETALAGNSSALSCTDAGDGWDCTHNFVRNLLDATKNPLGLKIKTAVVGFGSAFNNVTSFDRTKTQAQNIAALGTINTDVKKAAYWGIIGEGGWYSGNSAQDIVNSVNSFLGDLGTEIPSVTTGSPTIPKDALNPAILQDDAYYQQFQPTPDKGYSLWVGNLKKYTVAASGRLQGRNSANVTDSRGRLVLPTYDSNGKLTSAVYDFWSASVDGNTTIADADENTFGSRKFAAKGGVWSQLKLRTATDGSVQRKLLTNRIATGTGTSATFAGSPNTLRQVNITDLTDATYQNDPSRGYLISLLGYNNLDAADPASISAVLSSAPELRQVGAVMHSLPVLVTNKGKVTYNAATKKIGSTNREDYVLFGTTQGILHVVDATTGQEKFAFVPNEMVDRQKQGFQNYTSTSGGMSSLYYGMDGPWSTYTEYVLDTSGNLTVGAGKGTNQKGKQLAFGGLRMGGRSYYSLDLQDINSPKLNFHINPDGVSSGALSFMGQSWSKPTIGYVNWNGKRKMVMFVGGGYDSGYESDSYNQTNKKGSGVYMFSAEGVDAGTLLWWASDNASTSTGTTTTLPIGRNDANMKYSVVSEIRTVDRDGDDLIDHLYFGDLGGQLFRIDLDNKAKTLADFSKQPVRLLNLHVDGKSPRFYDMPSFSIYSESGKTFAVVSVGSGNRSKPLQSYTTGTADIVNDSVYNIYDKDVARKDLFTATSWNTKDITNLVEVTNTNRIKAAIKNATGQYVNKELVAPFSSTNGWYYKFANCVTSSDGTRTGCSDYKLQSEKVFGTPLAMNYRLYVSTFDSSKPGISGDCGAGVKGESFLTTFCMPYGQCATAAETGNTNGANPDVRGISIGIGIQNVTTGNCVGDECGGGGGGSQSGEKVASASNYCANTGGRILVTTTGSAGGVGQATQMCLIPQRWYEKNTLIK